MKISNEMILRYLGCKHGDNCRTCIAHDLCCTNRTVSSLFGEALLKERKHNVWEGAPDNAADAEVVFKDVYHKEVGDHVLHTRDPIKSHAETVVENLIHDWHSKDLATDENLKKRIMSLLENYHN